MIRRERTEEETIVIGGIIELTLTLAITVLLGLVIYISII